jgi:DNA invertase Pin-like site-specific DNA recombinase
MGTIVLMLTLDAYVRVSQVRGRGGDSFISPTVQRERIAAWAAAHGHRIGKVFEELDVSGGTVDRPKLNEVMRRIEAGETGGVVVFKLDRFGRTLIDSLALIERIKVADATFASVSDGFDLSTDTGRLVLRIMLSLAEFELERIRGNWNEARERAIGRGIHLAATVPFGYQRRDDGGLERHPVNGAIVKELFARRAAGEGWAGLIRWMEGTGAKTSRGRSTWRLRALRDIIRSEVYLGVASHGEYRREGAHDALTDEVTWRRAQRDGRQTVSRATEPALLTGLLRCAGCRYGMRAATRTLKSGEVVHDYRCRCGAEQAGMCTEAATATATEGIEQFVVDAFFARMHDMRARHAEDTDRQRLAELEAERDHARATLEDFAGDARVQAALGINAYVAGLQARREAVEAAQRAVDAATDALQWLPGDMEISLHGTWPKVLTVDEKRRLLGSVIDCVFVRRRDGRQPLAERVCVLWRGESAGLVLPGKGRRNFEPIPYLFDAQPSGAGEALSQDRDPRLVQRIA